MSITLENVSKTIRKIPVLTDVSITFHEGRITGLKGINGSGKTMIMRVVAGLIRPTQGKVMIDEKELWKDLSFPEDIGLLIENPAFLPYLTGKENLALLADINRKADASRIADVLAQVGLEPDSPKKFEQYSLGMKQRLGIAAAVMEHPHILVLDEPTNALDTRGIEALKDILREEKLRSSIIILSCHDYSILKELSDEIYSLEEGRVIGHEVV